MTDTPPSDGPSQGAEFDMMGALDWKDGIATLPGSDIRFRMTEFGTLEIVTDVEVKGQEAEPKSEILDPAPSHTPTPPPEGQSQTGTVKASANQSQPGSSQGKGTTACLTIPTPLSSDVCFYLYFNLCSVSAAPNKKRAWSWPAYLEEERAIAAPLKLFKEHQSFPQSRNGFKVGMKLEGLDPSHPSLFCVLSVAEIQGYRVRLHFDGYPECYDFWANADSWDLKPACWCEKNGHKLLLPKGCKDGEFNWSMYVKNCRGQLAPKHLFKSLNTSVTPSGFRAGMKLEAVDRKNPSLICVATIAAVVDNRLLIHFDNWDDTYDYWCDASSPYIHPVGYCEEAELTLTTPAEYKQPRSFSWEKYLEETGTQAAPARAFKPRPPHGFHVGMKVEAVDKRNPMLIRVATISDIEDHRVKIHFDGWSSEYDYWVETDCSDLHPVGWCQKTGHPLQYPNGETLPGQGCPTPGCNGVGHIRGPRYGTHYTQVSCPYSEMNLNKEGLLPDRLSGERPVTLSGPHARGRRPDPNSSTATQTSSTPEQPEGAEDSQNRSAPEHAQGQHYQITIVLRCVNHHLTPTDCCLSSLASPDAISLQQALHESVFSPGISASPPHRVALCWDKHCQLLPEVLGLTAKRVAAWNTEEVSHQIDGEAFLLLTQADIVKILSIKLGPALKIYNSILMLKNADEE
uniref:Lethal(3)malignant brain tumor-like protein 4 n=1 Tax=Echeneis naucrates TaxID=173247 RepID=A0A665WBC1_ECHNA